MYQKLILDLENNLMTERKAIKTEQQDKILAGIIDNESKTYTFTKTISVGGKKKEGQFTAKYLGVTARLRIGTLRAKLLDGAPAESVDTLTDDIAFMISYLTVALIKTPSWWNYDELDDIEDLRAMYFEVYNFMQSFRSHDESNSNVGHSSTTTSSETVESK